MLKSIRYTAITFVFLFCSTAFASEPNNVDSHFELFDFDAEKFGNYPTLIEIKGKNFKKYTPQEVLQMNNFNKLKLKPDAVKTQIFVLGDTGKVLCIKSEATIKIKLQGGKND